MRACGTVPARLSQAHGNALAAHVFLHLAHRIGAEVEDACGKDGIGMTPQCAAGSIDQHSQLQLYACGPEDKYFIFLSAKYGSRAPLSSSLTA